MLTRQETETIRAALQFWREEICPHGEAAARHYLEIAGASPLSVTEIEELRDRFARSSLRYATLEPRHNQLADTKLYETAKHASAVAGVASVATVIMPGT
ncbi:MAG: hypothetical protein MI757_16265 [Pirellulales bacterium]|nr:hypothetical protein [Pirellulales bacterium]